MVTVGPSKLARRRTLFQVLVSCGLCFLFFFQAEDGIRDTSVTGVQTCALPISPKPTNLTFEQAAAVPTSACTALQALRGPGEIQPGQTVLINGASGGIGLFAVQIAKSLGAEVTGVCSTPKMDMVHAIGADHVIDYAREDFTRSAQRYDLILDMVGNRSLSQLRRALTPRGTLVLVGGEGGDRWIGALSRSMRGLVMSPFVSQRLRPVLGAATTRDLEFLKELIEAGKVRPVVDRTFPLS